MAIDVVAAAHRTARRSRDITMDFDRRLRFPGAPERMDKKDAWTRRMDKKDGQEGWTRYIYISARDEGKHPPAYTARVMTSLQVIMNYVVLWRKNQTKINTHCVVYYTHAYNL